MKSAFVTVPTLYPEHLDRYHRFMETLSPEERQLLWEEDGLLLCKDSAEALPLIRKAWKSLGFKYPMSFILSDKLDRNVIVEWYRNLRWRDRHAVETYRASVGDRVEIHIDPRKPKLWLSLWKKLYTQRKEDEAGRGGLGGRTPDYRACTESEALHILREYPSLSTALLFDLEDGWTFSEEKARRQEVFQVFEQERQQKIAEEQERRRKLQEKWEAQEAERKASRQARPKKSRSRTDVIER